jgi:hypothetical protein
MGALSEGTSKSEGMSKLWMCGDKGVLFPLYLGIHIKLHKMLDGHLNRNLISEVVSCISFFGQAWSISINGGNMCIA